MWLGVKNILVFLFGEKDFCRNVRLCVSLITVLIPTYILLVICFTKRHQYVGLSYIVHKSGQVLLWNSKPGTSKLEADLKAIPPSRSHWLPTSTSTRFLRTWSQSYDNESHDKYCVKNENEVCAIITVSFLKTRGRQTLYVYCEQLLSCLQKQRKSIFALLIAQRS